MYARHSLDLTLQFAALKAQKNLEQYKVFYDTTLDFVRKSKEFIVVENYDSLSHPIDIYMDEEIILRVARDIADACYDADHQYGYFTSLTAQVGRYSMKMFIMGKTIVNYTALRHHRNLSMDKVLITVTHNNIHSFGYELKLLETLIKLGDPTNAEKWPQLIEEEKQLRRQWQLTASSKDASDDVDGGRDDTFVEKLVERFLQGGERLLVHYDNYRYKLVTGMNLNEEAQRMKDIFAAEGGAQLDMTYDSPNIPIDIRLRKVTFSYKSNKFCDLYNCASYGLIPYVEDKRELGGRIATSITRMRLLVTDYWIMILIHRMGKADANLMNAVCARIKKAYMTCEIGEYPLTVIGKLYPYDLWLKREHANEFVPPFIPAVGERG